MIRIIISVLFLLSGISKLFPIWQFEKQLVDLGLPNYCQAAYLARFIIGIELTIGVSILQNHYIKKIIIPFTIFLLILFNIHLSIQMYQYGPMNGNCGCFGQIIPMTPIEAFIKNIITIGLLIYLFIIIKEEIRDKIWILLLVFITSILINFLVFPNCNCCTTESLNESKKPESKKEDNIILNSTSDTSQNEKEPIRKDKIETNIKSETHNIGPKKNKSRFSKYTFNGKTEILDEDKKIVCMFAPGCDHCRETAREICNLEKSNKLPEVYILFMDEEPHLIPDFFREASCQYPYQIIQISEFWTLLGRGGNTPGVFYLWNGNIINSYEGIGDNKFNSEQLIENIKK